jgi:hypothetical protein
MHYTLGNIRYPLKTLFLSLAYGAFVVYCNKFNLYLFHVADYGYYADPNLLHRNDSMGNQSYSYDSPVHSQNSVSDWIKTSMIMGDHVNFDYFSDLSSNTLGQEERQGQYLVYKTQQLVQSRSFDDCTCSSYSSDVPQCTCDNAKTEHLKPR